MAGTIALTPEVYFPVKGSLFYWIVEVLAEQVDDRATQQRLREISDDNLGWLGLADFPPPGRTQLLNTIRAVLVPIGEQRLPDTPARPVLLAELQRLADLAEETE